MPRPVEVREARDARAETGALDAALLDTRDHLTD
jgi:hypothetical protein